MSSKIYFITTPKPYNPVQIQTVKKIEGEGDARPTTFKIEPKVVVDEGISINFNINESTENSVSNLSLSRDIMSSTTTTTTSPTTSSSTSTITTTTTTIAPTTITTTESSLLMRILKDQGPQALGVGVASFAYTALAAMPYWLPFVAGRKRRSVPDAEYANDHYFANDPMLR